MNIGFDGKRAASNLTGLGNYSRSLITQLAKLFDQNQYFVYTPKVKNTPQVNSFFEAGNIFLRLPLQRSLKFIWRSFGIKKQLREDHIDLFHGLSHEIPIGLNASGIKSIVTIHDLIYLRYPQYYKTIDRYIYHLKGRYACNNSNRIIAISERTKLDIIEFYQVHPDKIEVIYQSCDDSFKQSYPAQSREAVKAKYALPDKYLLNVGTIEPRKNLLLIVNALQKIPEEYKLVVVGKGKPYADQVIKQITVLGLTDRVVFLKDVSFTDLPVIYQMATVFVYPSFYEGFGIPVIEALFSNIPVIAATGSCLEEAGGPNSIYIHPEDPEELAIQVNKILNDEELQNRMKAKGLEYVQKFDNRLLTRQMMDCYSRTLNSNFTSC